MGFYNKYVLPRFLNAACGTKPIIKQREKVVPACTGRVLEVGMGSGLMGSYAAAASVNSENEDGVRILRNRREEGRWLLLLETPTGIDLPWQTVQRCRPLQVVRLSEL